MSDSESENLEFESADEGQNEADLSDLDLDEILNEDDNNDHDHDKIPKLPIEPNKTTPDSQDEEASRPQDESNTDKKLETEPKNDDVQVANDEEVIRNEENKSRTELEPEPEAESEPKKPSIWEEQDEDVDKMLNDMNLNEEEKKEHQVAPQPEPKSNTKTPPIVEQKATTSGWDDTNFSDIDDDDETPAAATIKQEESKSRLDEEAKTKLDEEKPAAKKETTTTTGWSWSKFGTNILSSAATLTSQVFETVEAHLGAPDPTELAAKIAKSKSEHDMDNNPTDEAKAGNNDKGDTARASLTPNETKNWQQFEDSDWFTFNKLTSTGTNLVSGSLDVLETVGKKTFEMISDKDPSLKQTKELLKKVPVPVSNKPNLSQLLREAQSENSKKLDSAESHKTQGSPKPDGQKAKKQVEKITFSLYFEEYKGTAHLEALEMLSSQASLKLETALISRPVSRLSEDVRNDLETLETLFDVEKLNPDDDETQLDVDDFKLLVNNKDKMFDIEHFEFLINEYARRASLKIIIDKVIGAYRTAAYASKELLSPSELFNESVKCFALITSNSIELFHKAAESSFLEFDGLSSKNSSKTIKSSDILENAEILFKITKLTIKAVAILSDDYCKKCKLNSKQFNQGNPNQIITDIFLEASNSNTYISDAFVLFLPIFKSQLLKTAEKSS